MAMLPKLKIKALVSFPANVFGGTGISIDKTAGNFTIDLNYSEFAFQGTLPTGSNVLVWDPVANVYTLVPPSATGGISDAPTDGKTYGRKLAAWVDAWASPVLTGNPTAPTPAALDNDTSIATTAFVTSAISSIPAGTPPPVPATATPIADGAGAVGVSLKYAREDHVHPAGAAGSGDVVGPSSAVDSNLAAFNTTTGKLIKDSGVPLAAASGAVRYDLPQGLTAPQQKQARANIAVNDGNVIINGDFRVNQGGYVSAAALTVGLYGHDQWKAGASGGDYSFSQLKSSTQITIAAGKSLIQPIEDVNVVGGSYVLSWTGTAQARAGVNTLTPSGSYAASPLLITGQTAGTVMSVEFNSGTLGTVKLESGANATPFIMRPYDQELVTCKRYWHSSYDYGVAPGSADVQTYITMIAVTNAVLYDNYIFPVQMRAQPTISIWGYHGETACWSTSSGVLQTGGSLVAAGRNGFSNGAAGSLTVGAGYVTNFVANARL